MWKRPGRELPDGGYDDMALHYRLAMPIYGKEIKHVLVRPETIS
jgi:hypothetical protein